jgi:PAS domain S-box-containing protein
MSKIMKDDETARCAELAAILACTHDAVVGSTPLGVIISWNPAAAELYGYAAEDILGHSTEVLVPSDHRDEESMVVRRVLRGEPAEEYCTARVCRDGSVGAVSLATAAVVDTTHAVIGAVMVSRRLGVLPERRDRFTERADGDRTLEARTYRELLLAQLQQARRLEVLSRLVAAAARRDRAGTRSTATARRSP